MFRLSPWASINEFNVYKYAANTAQSPYGLKSFYIIIGPS
ncbi:hypothetical protein SynA1528_00335 [Synechococcus sp. A15-28]|nr:hypothetical protein SynA1528_00335 [Synechococcus sp. A15-28]